MILCTGEVEPLDLLGLPSHVYWSPDGRHLLFYTAGRRNDTVGIVLYNFESQESRIISEIPAEGFWLYGWSPDSKKVAFVSKQTGQYDLYTLNVESLALQQLTDSPAIEELVSWSPANNHLLVGTFPLEEEFTLNEGPTIDTFYILDDSGAQLRLLGNSYRAWTAAWSPDGEKIVYSNYGALCIIDVEEQSEICPLEEIFPVTEYSIAFDEPAAWSSGGDWLAFQMVERHKDPCYLMYMLELSTNTVVRAAQQMCLGSPLHWSSRP